MDLRKEEVISNHSLSDRWSSFFEIDDVDGRDDEVIDDSLGFVLWLL